MIETDKTTFQQTIDQLDLTKYEFIYISLGSKFNEETIVYPYCGKEIQKKSNAVYQMIPEFIRAKKALSICIDRFDKNSQQKTKDIIESTIDFIICDLDGTIQLFEQLITFLKDKFIYYDIDPNIVMIANYIRFISPNHTEYYLEQNLSDAIVKVLYNTPYSDRLYEWFGYQPNLYNIIYKYKRFIIGLSYICTMLQKKIGNNELSLYNIDSLFDNDKVKMRAIELFLENTYDITNETMLTTIFKTGFKK